MTALENNLRWQSRRGLLELDLVLQKFWRRAENERPTTDELRALGALLAMDDNDLWAAIMTTDESKNEDKVTRRLMRRLQSL